MWEKPVYEGAKECLDSLKDLQNKCDEISAQFFDRSNSTDDEQYFFSMLLRSIGSYCNDAGKDITKMGKKNISLEMILKSFRTKSYPFILLLIYSLPDSSHTKQECADKFDLGLDNSNLTLEKINPKWLIG